MSKKSGRKTKISSGRLEKISDRKTKVDSGHRSKISNRQPKLIKTREANIEQTEQEHQESFVFTASQNLGTKDIKNTTLLDLVENEINPDKYTLHEMLGEGGMGAVFLAKEKGIKRELAFKVMKSNLTSNTGSLLRFIEEAQITGQLEHPNIVPVHELGIDSQGNLAFTMKRVKGHLLKEIIEEEREGYKSLSLVEKLNIFMKICDAVSFAHSMNVIHRDLKPENIMVGEFDEVLVMDWGLAKVLGENNIADEKMLEDIETVRKDIDEPALTMDGDYIGTPTFMSPEQAQGETEAVDKQSDIFLLGGVLYNMLTLEFPYTGRTVYEVLMKSAGHNLIPPTNRIKNLKIKLTIPKELEAIVMKSMNYDKQLRYRSVKNFKKDIEAFLSNEPVTAYRDNIIERAIKWSKRNPTKAMTIALSVVFILIISVIISFTISQIQSGKLENEKLAREKAEQRERAERLAREKAEADKLGAEQRERAEREAKENLKKEAKLREAKIKERLQKGEINELKKELGVKVEEIRSNAMIEFSKAYNEKVVRQNMSIDEFLNSYGKEKLLKLKKDFTRVIELGNKYPAYLAPVIIL